jgi:hypothetical protein
LASQEEKGNARQQSVCSKWSRRGWWQQWKWKWVGEVGSERQVLLFLVSNHSSGCFREWIVIFQNKYLVCLSIVYCQSHAQKCSSDVCKISIDFTIAIALAKSGNKWCLWKTCVE